MTVTLPRARGIGAATRGVPTHRPTLQRARQSARHFVDEVMEKRPVDRQAYSITQLMVSGPLTLSGDVAIEPYLSRTDAIKLRY